MTVILRSVSLDTLAAEAVPALPAHTVSQVRLGLRWVACLAVSAGCGAADA